jgi:glycosyltransferase involved in cell wall biosynthesis
MMTVDRPLSIIHIISNLDTGGAEMMLYRLLSILDRELFEPAVISLTGIGPVGKKIERLRIPVLALRMRRNSPNPWHLFRLARWCRRSRADIVQTWMYHADLLGLLAAKLTGTPKLVWTIRSADIPFNSYRPQTGLLAKLCSVLSSVPDGIVANSHAGIRHHAGLGYPPRQMRLIPNGFDVECFRPDAASRFAVRRELGLREETLVIGLVARWDSLKDHSMFMEAASSISRTHEDTRFVLVGRNIEWETEQLAALIRAAGLQDRMILLGEREDIPRLTAAFDIACSSSITEGFPTTIGEAMACGVPCVVTDVGDAAAIVGDTGRVVPAGDGVAFAQACKELISLGPNGRRDLGARGRERIINRYALSTVVKMYEDLYTSLGRPNLSCD